MKKYLPLLSIPALMTLNSCMQEDIVKNGGQEVTAKVKISLPGNEVQSRSNDADGTEGSDINAPTNPSTSSMRLFIFVYQGDKIVKKIDAGLTNPDTYTADLRLVTGQPYKIAAWADFGDDYYEISDGVVKLKDMDSDATELNRNGNQNLNDAYYICKDVTLEGNETIDLPMSRPFGLVQITTNDWDLETVDEAGLQPKSYEATIKVPTTFTMLSGKTDNIESVTFAGDINDNEQSSQKLSFDYIFAEASAQSILDNFTMVYSKDGNKICDYEFKSIPVQRNYITNVSGNVLTKNGKVDIKIEQAWAEDDIIHNLKEVSSVEELEAAILAAKDGDVIVVKPGRYGNISLEGLDTKTKKAITIQGTKVENGSGATRASEATETVFTGSIFGDVKSSSEVYKNLKIVIDGIKFEYDKGNLPSPYNSSVGVACIGNTQYNAIGELVVRNCTFIPNSDVENLFFIGTNHNPNENCRSVIKLYNNKIGTDDVISYNSWYPVRLWNVTNVEVIGNEFIVPQGFTGLQHLNISKLSASENASVIVKDNTFKNGNAGISISTWMLGDNDHANQTYKGKIEVSDNKFINVATQTIENPKRCQVPIFISPEYINDNIEEGRADKHGLFDTFVVVENNTYEGTPRENVIVSQKMNIKTVNELFSALENQLEGQEWIINEGTYDVTKLHEQNINAGTKSSRFVITANNISIKGNGNTEIKSYADGLMQGGDSSKWEYNQGSTILVYGNNVTIEGLTVRGIDCTEAYVDIDNEGHGNKAITASGSNNLTIKDCTILPAENKQGGSIVFDGEWSGKTAKIENTQVFGAIITGYMNNPADGSITLNNVEINPCYNDYYYAPFSSSKNSQKVVTVEGYLKLHVYEYMTKFEEFTLQNAFDAFPTGSTVILHEKIQGPIVNSDPYYTNTLILTNKMTVTCAEGATLSGIIEFKAPVVLDKVNYQYNGYNTIYGNFLVYSENVEIKNSSLYANFDMINCVHSGNSGRNRSGEFGFIRPSSKEGFKMINNTVQTNAMGIFGGNLVNAEISGNTFKNLDRYTSRTVWLNDAAMNNVEISDNTIYNRHMVLGGNANITNNKFLNLGENGTSGNAFYFWNEFTGVISGNDYSGRVNPDAPLATGREGITIPVID